ncbi:MAG: hypothetical protein LBG06_10970 [Deltaproteobacteria bacterium]|jgi:tetratricopeptide (TPR) repeat protein|nr:hypothetical protein [Deltaproteobacteria bacterium]
MDTRVTVNRLLGLVEGYASEVERMSGEFHRHLAEDSLDVLRAKLRGVNMAAADTLEKLRPFQPGLDGAALSRFGEARLRANAASLYEHMLAGSFETSISFVESLSEELHPKARDAFRVKACSCGVFFATLRRNPDSGMRVFTAMEEEPLSWELSTDRAMAAFNLFFSLVKAGRAEEAMPYYYLIVDHAETLRDYLAREGELARLPVPVAAPYVGQRLVVRFYGPDFPFALARTSEPDFGQPPDPDKLLEYLDTLLQMRFDAVRTLGVFLLLTDKSFMVKKLFTDLAAFCSTDSDCARLALLGRDLVLMCCQTEEHVGDGSHYLGAVERFARTPPAVTCAAEAGHQLIAALASRDRIREAVDIYRRLLRLHGPGDTDDWKAKSAASIITAFLERPGAKDLTLMEQVYQPLLTLHDSPVVWHCRLFVETNILPFYLVLGDPGRISDVYGRIAGSPDETQTGLEMKLAASTNLVSYHAAGGRLEEARRHFTLIDIDRHREPPFLQNWARAAAALSVGFYHCGEETEAWLLASEIDRYSHVPEVEECLGRLRMIMGDMPPRTLH